MTAELLTRRELREHIAEMGLRRDDSVMVHAALRSVGAMLNDPDALIGAILDVLGPGGTLLAYASWNECYEELIDEEGRAPADLRDDIPAFEPHASRANREHGAIAEFVRTWPGALRSGSPGASVAAIGARAAWFTADHPLDYGYGPGSPFAKLVEAEGKVLMIGAPLDTMTLLHHAEHLADIPGKRMRRYEVPLIVDGKRTWRQVEEFDTTDPVVEGLDAEYFADIVDEFLDDNEDFPELARRGFIGSADSVLVSAAAITAFAVEWLEEQFPR